MGDITRLDYATVTDPLTGAAVTRLTEESANTWYPYFTQPVFDGGRLLVCSDRGGETQLYLLDLEARRMVQLTDLAGGVGAHQATILPGRGQVAFVAGQALCRLDLETCETAEIFHVIDGFGASILSPSRDGLSVTFAIAEQMETATRTSWQYSDFNERLYRRPSCLIFRVDTATGRAAALWGEREWISHVIVSPVDDDQVVFCHEGPWDRVQRLWLLRAGSGQVQPLLPYEPGLGRAGHEFFTDQGLVGVQYARRMTRRAKDWVYYNVLTDPEGREPRFWRYPAEMPGHFQASSDGTLFVGDRAHIDADFDAGGSCLGLLHHRDTERVEVELLCRHDTSWKTQISHPHPVFSPDDTMVYFNSDCAGRAAVYRVPTPH